jgi:hypothetical protein
VVLADMLTRVERAGGVEREMVLRVGPQLAAG